MTSTTATRTRRKRTIPATGQQLRTGLRAVVAARISKFTEESVSVETQLRDGRKYAKGEDWSVVGTLKDEDVSATEIHPLDRPEL